MLYAAADLGTNTFRLVIVNKEPDGQIEEVLLSQKVVRLGQGIGVGGIIDPNALERARDCLEEFGRQARDVPIANRVVVLTAVGRSMEGREALFSLVERTLGVVPTVPEGDREAMLSFAGAKSFVDAKAPSVLLLDIGGGSTEVVMDIEGQKPLAMSFPVGVVRLSESMPLSDPPTEGELRNMFNFAAKVWDNLPKELCARARDHFAQGRALLLANAGTALTLAAHRHGVAIADTRKLSGLVVTREETREVFDLLSRLTCAQRAGVSALAKGREDVILAGLVLMLTFMDHVGAPAFTTSDGGVAEGALAELIVR